VAQGVGPEFKPQYHGKKKKDSSFLCSLLLRHLLYSWIRLSLKSFSCHLRTLMENKEKAPEVQLSPWTSQTHNQFIWSQEEVMGKFCQNWFFLPLSRSCLGDPAPQGRMKGYLIYISFVLNQIHKLLSFWDLEKLKFLKNHLCSVITRVSHETTLVQVVLKKHLSISILF
jgi:hypothetical protein